MPVFPLTDALSLSLTARLHVAARGVGADERLGHLLGGLGLDVGGRRLVQLLPLVLAQLDDAGGLTGAAAQVVELGAADAAAADHLDAVEARAVERKHALDPLAVGDLAHREGRVDAAVAPRDAHALEGLHALAVALDHLHVHPQRVARPEVGDLPLLGGPGDLLALELLDDVHGRPFLWAPYRRRLLPYVRAASRSGRRSRVTSSACACRQARMRS